MLEHREQNLEEEEQKKHIFLEIGPDLSPVPMVGKRKFDGNNYYVGIDINADSVESDKKRAESHGMKNVSFAQGDGRKMPFADETVDEVFLSNVFGSPKVANDEKTINLLFNEISRVCQKNGILIIKETNTPEAMHYDKIKEIAEQYGFTVEQMVRKGDENWDEMIELYSTGGFRYIESQESYIVSLKKLSREEK